MKALLLGHVKGLGQKGELKEVSDGYFQNFLMPRGLAVPATGGQVKHIHAQQAKAVEKLENMKESALAVKARIEGHELTILEKASEAGKLYAALHTKEVVSALESQLGVQVSEKAISLDPIKNTGDYTVSLALFKGVQATVHLHVRAS